MGSGMAAEYSYLLQEEVDHPSSPYSADDSSEMDDLFDDLRSVDDDSITKNHSAPSIEAPSISSSPLAENIPTQPPQPLQEYLGLSDDDDDDTEMIMSSPPLSKSIQKRRALANRLFSNKKETKKSDSWSTHSALRELETSLQLQSPPQVKVEASKKSIQPSSSSSKSSKQQTAHIQVLQKQLQEQQSLLESMESEKQSLQKQLQQQQVQSEGELEEALDLYETLQQQHSKLQNQHQQTLVDKSQLESQVSSLTQSNHDLEAQLELLQSRHDTLVKELEAAEPSSTNTTTDQVDQLTLLQTQLDLEVDRRLAAEAQVQQLLLASKSKNDSEDHDLVDDVLQDMTALTHERQELLQELNIQDGEDGESNHDSSLQHSSRKDDDDTSWQANMLNVSAASSSKLLQQQEQDDDDISTASTPTHTNTSGLQLLNASTASHSVSTTSNLMNQTLELMQNMTAVLNSPQNDSTSQEPKDKDTSILLNQLEALHELMNKDSNEEHNEVGTDSFVMNAESTILQAEDDPLNTSAISHASSSSTNSPWFALVQELRRTVDYLQHDRSELERITQDQLDRLKASHCVELEAAIATARREGRASVQQQTVCPKCGTETTQS